MVVPTGQKQPSKLELREREVSYCPILRVFSAQGETTALLADVSACSSSIQPRLSHCTKIAREVKNSKIIRMEWSAIELLVKPSEYANLGRAKRFQPAVEEKIRARRRGGNLL